jgi:hypothetical protein
MSVTSQEPGPASGQTGAGGQPGEPPTGQQPGGPPAAQQPGGPPAGQQDGGPPGTQPDPGKVEPGPAQWTLTWLKEGTTVLLAVGIAAVTLWVLIRHFVLLDEFQVTPDLAGNPALLAAQQAAHEAAIADRLNVVNIAVAILGVVTGYFFGRVPVERRAEKAEQAAQANAETAQANAETASTATADRQAAELQSRDAKQTIERVLSQLGATAGGSRTLGSGGAGNEAPVPAETLAELHALRDRLS